GVQMGTAFVTSTESGAKKQHKVAIEQSSENQTVITSVFSGKPARGVRNNFIAKMEELEGKLPPYPIQNTLTKAIRSEAAKQNLPKWMSLWCGQNPRLSNQQPVSEIITKIVSQIDDIVKNQLANW